MSNQWIYCVASRAALSHPTMSACAAIEKLSNELLTEIILLAGTEGRKISVFCWLSRTLRDVALDTPGLWTNLSTTCYITKEWRIRSWYVEYLAFWTTRVQHRNDFSLTFKVDICIENKDKDWIALVSEPKAKIFRLVSCARYIHTYGTGLGFLARWFHSGIPWPLESIVFSSNKSVSEYGNFFLDEVPGIEPLLRAFNLPVLRKCSISDEITCPLPYQIDLQTWGQLTHIDVTLRTTLSDWRGFIGALRLLQSARIKIDLQDGEGDEDSGTHSNNNLQHTIADLEELWLEISCWRDPPIVGSVLDGIYLPNLKTFIVASPRLTIDSLHRLLQDKRLVQRIRVSSMFPTLATDTNLLVFPSAGESLVDYAPHLTRLVIAIPDLHKFQPSMMDYVDRMYQSQWLKGRNDRMQMVLPWLTAQTRQEIDNLHKHLYLQGIGDVVIECGLPPYGEGDFDASRWDHVVDFDAQFYATLGSADNR